MAAAPAINANLRIFMPGPGFLYDVPHVLPLYNGRTAVLLRSSRFKIPEDWCRKIAAGGAFAGSPAGQGPLLPSSPLFQIPPPPVQGAQRGDDDGSHQC